MKRKFTAIVMAMLIVMMGGCSSKPAEEPALVPDTVSQIHETAVNVSPQSGGKLELSMRTTQTLNPLTNEDESVDNILKLIYEPLIKLDEKGKPSPNIAESWGFSEDGRLLTINLKNNILFHDGSNLTADDVIFSFNTIRNAGENAVYKNCIANIVSFSKSGSYSVQILFDHAFSGNIYSMVIPIISSSYYRGENVNESKKNLEPLGTGPYRFESFTPAKKLVLTATNGSLSGTPYIDSIEVLITPDKNTDLYSFDQGIIDATAADETDMGKYDNSKNTKKYEFATNYYDFLGFNFNRTILQDKNIRKAVAYAIPKQNIMEGVYLNHAIDAQSPVNPTSWLYEEDTVRYEYNLNLAKVLLDESKWIDTNGDKIREKTTNEYSETLKLTILTNEENEERHQTALRLADELNAVGFDITVDVQPFEKYVEKLNNKDFDMFIGGWQLSVVPDFSFMFQSNQINGGKNYISYNSEVMNQLLSVAYNAIGETSTLESYSNLQKYIAEEIPYISIVFRNSAVFTDEKICGEIKPLQNNIFDNIEEWFIYEKTANN